MFRMKWLICVVLVGASFGSARLVRADEPGFTPIFNGKDLTGWTTFVSDGSDPKKVWNIKDGVIHCAGKPTGYLLTTKEYGDYVLRLQWRWPDAAKAGNSGVFIHVSGPDKIWPKGVEAQLMTGRAGDFWLVDGYKMAIPKERNDPNSPRHYIRLGETWKKTDQKDAKGRDKYTIVGKNVEKPLGEWNEYEITCKGDNIKLTVNGQFVNEGTNCESTSGKILLQSEGAPVEFRNVRIKSLK